MVAKGVYKNGEEEGFWFYIIGQEYTYGKYENGLKTGIWKSEILDGTVIFIGEFQLGLPIGKHQFWFKNGKPKKEGRYSGGEKNGDWYFYGEYGEIILTVTYKNGIETHYNQQKINPENKAAKIQLGSMVQTDKACFYIAIAYGQIAIDDTNIFVISSIAPIAQQMLGKSINDQFEMNGLTYTIGAIV